MALRNILKLGEDEGVLRSKAKMVIRNRDIRSVLKDMSETMYSEKALGLAANQIGVLKRLVVIDIGEGLINLVNPVIVKSNGEQYEQEGCLSVPNLLGMVKRPERVVVKAYNEKGKRVEINGEGLLASVLCHEIDHLDGVLFIDKVKPGTLASTSGRRIYL